MTGLIVRASTEADVARCMEIYRHHVLHGTASFEIDPPDLGEMKRRRAAVLELCLPHLVAERDGRVLGYAYAGNWRPRPASMKCSNYRPGTRPALPSTSRRRTPPA